MASNKEIDQLNVNDAIKRQLKTVQQAPVMFNMLNLIPTGCEWIISAQDMEGYVMKTAEEFLGRGEVKQVTIDAGASMKKPPRCFVWISRDSRHLVDRSVSDANAVFTPQVDRYSDDLRTFCANFAPHEREDGTPINKKKRVQIVGSDDSRLVGIIIDINKVIMRIFDYDNRAFQDAFGRDVPVRPVTLRAKVISERRGDENRIVALQIKKQFESANTHRRPRPLKNFSDRNRD
jgi:hypothetical protein